MSLPIHRWSQLPREVILGGKLERTALRTEHSIVTFNWFAPDAPRAEPHSHPFDQLVMVVYGRLKLEVDGEILLLDSGTAVRIPPNVPHTAWPAERQEVLNIDVFAPIRADYLFLAGHQHDKFDTDLEIREGADPPSYGPK